MASDLTVAIALARAGLEGALANVEINLDSFEPGTEGGFISDIRNKVAELRKVSQVSSSAHSETFD
jgi:formiminotetrahydrofolate cyclodeaminase